MWNAAEPAGEFQWEGGAVQYDPIGFGCRSRPRDTVPVSAWWHCILWCWAAQFRWRMSCNILLIPSLLRLRMMKVPRGRFGFDRAEQYYFWFLEGEGGVVRWARDMEDAETRRGVSILIQRRYNTSELMLLELLLCRATCRCGCAWCLKLKCVLFWWLGASWLEESLTGLFW